MVGFNQIVSIALIIGVAYVAIQYGPDIVKKAKASFDEMQANAQSAPDTSSDGGPGFMQGLPQPSGGSQPTSAPPQVDDSSLVNPPDMTTSSAPPDTMPNGSVQDYTVPGNGFGDTGIYNLPSAPSTANSQVDKSGLLQQYPTVSSPQNPVHKKKKGSTTITKQQRQQEHMQNTQTSQGHPVAPPHVSVSQAHPSVGPATDTPRRPRPVPPSTGGRGNIQSRFAPGTQARADIEFQIGCNCNGTTCCYRGHTCDGSISAECTHTASPDKATTDRACAALRTRFLNKNPCTRPASKAPKSAFPPIRPAPCAAACAPFKNSPGTYSKCCRNHLATPRVQPKMTTEMALNPTANVAYGIGDTGDIVSLDSMFVTVA